MTGNTLVIETDLPHLPPDAKVTVAWLGRPKAVFPAREGKGTVDISRYPPGEYALTVEAKDPQSPRRSLYYRSISVRKEDAAGFPTALADARLVVACDGVAWDGERGRGGDGAKGSGPVPLWDHLGTVRAALAGKWPAGEVTARAEVVSRNLDDRERGRVQLWPGETRLQVAVTIANPTQTAQRVLAAGLRLSLAGRDETERFLIVPLSSLPAAIPPGGRAEQVFRVDTFDDTPVGDYRIEPLVLCAPADADLLSNGAFEEQRVLGPPSPPTLGGLAEADPPQSGGLGGRAATAWVTPADAPEGFHAETVKAGGSYSELGMLLADWSDYTKLSFTNDRRIAAQGNSLLEASFAAAPAQPRIIAQQMVNLSGQSAITNLQSAMVLGVSSWGGSRVVLEWLNAAGLPVGAQERCFSGVWWHEQVAAWRARLFRVCAPPGAAAARLSLVAGEKVSWWDNAFLVPESAVRLAAATPGRLTLAGHRPDKPGGVVYLGEDRETKGNWIGSYGQHAWILCGMSAPRDMVGGMAKPLKCHHDDLSKTYKNETIWVRGTEELRYTAWTGNPEDVLVRHWIGAKRTEDPRALENPQWGYRTWACWDDHGELLPTNGWGPDLYVKLRLPPGLWQVSFYFVDWDWAGTPFPRSQRITFLDEKGAEVAAATATGFGEGVYKLFGVQGGRDLTLRLHKGASVSVALSGMFIDPIVPVAADLANAAVPQAEGPAVRRELGELATMSRENPTGFLRALPRYGKAAESLIAGSSAGGAAAAWLAAYRLFRSVPGRRTDATRALARYARALGRADGASVAAAALARMGDSALANGDLGEAERAYDQAVAVQRGVLGLAQLADAWKKRAIQFRVLHPRYALTCLRAGLDAADALPGGEPAAYLRRSAEELFGIAMEDYRAGRGLVRLPFRLPEECYRRLWDAPGSLGLQPAETDKLAACLEYSTWYTLGWDSLVASLEHLVARYPAGEAPGTLYVRLLRAYAVVAQSDPAGLEKAEAIADQMRKREPDGAYARTADLRMMQMYYQQSRSDKARKLAQALAQRWPKEPEGREAARLLQVMKR